MQEIATIPQDAAPLHGRVAGHLLHPRLVGVNSDPGDKVTSPRRVSTFVVKKSVPANRAKWVRMKTGHVVVRLRAGAGGTAWRCKTLPTV